MILARCPEDFDNDVGRANSSGRWEYVALDGQGSTLWGGYCNVGGDGGETENLPIGSWSNSNQLSLSYLRR
jgi:hypothetical protein